MKTTANYPDCQHEKPHNYNFNCVSCCARLIMSARPSRMHQQRMFTAIEGFKGAPKKQEILNCLAKKSSIPIA